MPNAPWHPYMVPVGSVHGQGYRALAGALVGVTTTITLQLLTGAQCFLQVCGSADALH